MGTKEDGALFPSLHHRREAQARQRAASKEEGRLRHQENVAKPPKLTQPGWFFFLFSIGKPPRPRDQRRLRGIFVDRSATPPCGDARRGIRSILIRLHLPMTAHDLQS